MECLKRPRLEPRFFMSDDDSMDDDDLLSAGKRRDQQFSDGRVKKTTESDRVWPPTLVGKRKAPFSVTEPYVHDSENTKLSLSMRHITGHPNAVVMKQITVESIKCDRCPVYVFSPCAEGFIRALYVDHHGEAGTRANFPKLSAGWTLKYATVEDMAELDPHRKLVDWIAMDTWAPSKEINQDPIPLAFIATPQCLSAIQKGDFQAKLEAMDFAKIEEEKIDMDFDSFAPKLKSILFQEGVKSSIRSLLKDIMFRGSQMKKAFAFNGVRVANASIERLSSFGVLIGEERDHAANHVFTSRLIHRGAEVELRTLQSTTEEIRRATATKRQLRQLQLDHLESARNLVEKQNKEMIQHLLEWTTKSQSLMEEDMMCRVKLVASVQQAEEKASVLQKFISAGATEIVEEAYSDALKEKDQELGVAKSNWECCICYTGLEGFSFAISMNAKKRHKRACFLPCMHASVCTTCSEKRWNQGPKECPICRQPLTERPRVIHL